MSSMQKLGNTLDDLVELLFADNKETRERAATLIREMMWDNKIGIIRCLQASQID